MGLDKYIPPKNLRTPLPQKAMAQDGTNVASQNINFGVNPWAGNLRDIGIGGLHYMYFVDVNTGDDANDGMSWATAKASINGAIAQLPLDMEGRECHIIVAPGLYTCPDNEQVVDFSNVGNGYIKLMWAGLWYNTCPTNIKVREYGGDYTIPNDNQIVLQSALNSPQAVVWSGRGPSPIGFGFYSENMATEWNAAEHNYAYRWKIQKDPNTTVVHSEGHLIGIVRSNSVLNIFSPIELNTDYCPAMVLYLQVAGGMIGGLKVRGSVVGLGNTSTGQNAGLAYINCGTSGGMTISNVWVPSNGWATGFAPSVYNQHYDVEGVRNLFSVNNNGCTINIPNLVYGQGVLPDANLPTILLNASARNYSITHNSNQCSVTNSSVNNGYISDAKTGIAQTILAPKLMKIGNHLVNNFELSALADASHSAKDVSVWLDETNHKLNYKVKYSNGSTVKTGKIDLVAPLEYTGLLSETGYAATSGLLIAGQTYYIANYVAGDDFTNVGGTNVTGNTFVASGTTPTAWTNSSILVSVGISAPAVTLLTNGLSGAIVWTYSAVGTYIGTLSGAFTENKTVFSYPPLGDDKAVTVEWTSANVITVKTYETGALKDGLLVKFPLTIKVYP